jgi:hypothetical protein
MGNEQLLFFKWLPNSFFIDFVRVLFSDYNGIKKLHIHFDKKIFEKKRKICCIKIRFIVILMKKSS